MPIIMKNRKCTISEYDRRFQAALSLWLPVILIYAAYVWQKEEIHMSIKKIAEKAGVSVSTVSRILNKPDYRCSVPGLRENVWSIAMEMNPQNSTKSVT